MHDPHSSFLAHAVALSVENVASGLGGPFGAVIVKDHEIIAEGANAVTRTQDPTAHAEVVTIRAACQILQTFNLSGCVLYSSCEPCPMCLSAAYWARLDAVYFAATQNDAAEAGFDDAFLYREVALPTEQRTLVCVGMSTARPSAREAFRLWIETLHKMPY